MFTFKIHDLLGIKPTKEKYMIDVMVYDLQLSKDFQYMYNDKINQNHIAFITFCDQYKKPSITWNIEPKADIFADSKNYMKTDEQIYDYFNENSEKILKEATELIRKEYPNIL